jgi:hypothetical protein
MVRLKDSVFIYRLAAVLMACLSGLIFLVTRGSEKPREANSSGSTELWLNTSSTTVAAQTTTTEEKRADQESTTVDKTVAPRVSNRRQQPNISGTQQSSPSSGGVPSITVNTSTELRTGEDSGVTEVEGSASGVVSVITLSPPTTIRVRTSTTTIPATTTTQRPISTTSTTLGANDLLLRIPLGTKTRIDGGDPVDDVMPPLFTARVGQTLVLVNEDTAFHVYGPFSIRPGESIRWRFTEAGDTVGYCTVGPGKVVTIRVTT